MWRCGYGGLVVGGVVVRARGAVGGAGVMETIHKLRNVGVLIFLPNLVTFPCNCVFELYFVFIKD